jgi:hypothetical protein
VNLSSNQRAMCATILVGCANLRLALAMLNTNNPRWVRAIRNQFDNIQDALTGSSPSVRDAVNAWDKVKENLETGLPDNVNTGEDVMYLFGAVDEAFYALLATLDVVIEPDMSIMEG